MSCHGSPLLSCEARATIRETSGRETARHLAHYVAASIAFRSGRGPKATRPLWVLVVTATVQTVVHAPSSRGCLAVYVLAMLLYLCFE